MLERATKEMLHYVRNKGMLRQRKKDLPLLGLCPILGVCLFAVEELDDVRRLGSTRTIVRYGGSLLGQVDFLEGGG